MGALTVLGDAIGRGLAVEALPDGRLQIRGPSRLGTIAGRVLECKDEVIGEMMREGVWERTALHAIAQVSDHDQQLDLRCHFEERAGIGEFVMNMPRNEAERIACVEVLRMIATGSPHGNIDGGEPV